MEFDFNTKMTELIDSVQDGNTEKLIDNKDKIDELADYCRKTPIYNLDISKEKSKEYSENVTAEEVYKDMIIKIAKAPALIARSIAILLIPIISDKLNKPIIIDFNTEYPTTKGYLKDGTKIRGIK